MARTPAGIRRAELVELLGIDEQIKELTARKTVLRDKALRAHLQLLDEGAIELPYTPVYGPVVLSLTEARTFDADAFAIAHPADAHPAFYRPTVDRDAVPKELREAFASPVRRISVRRAA